jgi:flavodoxin
MAALAALPLGATTATAAQGDAKRAARTRTLVAYFSRSGNTRVVAGLIQRARGADLFEIRPANPYPEDYLETVAQARKESSSAYKPALAAKVPRIADYDTVFLGFPIWGETLPPVIRSFLAEHDLSGKNLIPFVTHGGYGLGNSLSVLASDAPKARLLNGFTMEADQERRTMERVTGWLKNVG